jgi:hypothetical protein
MKKTILVFLVLTAVLAALPAEASATRWLHVRVQKKGDAAESVRVNVPVSVAQAVAPILEKELQSELKMEDSELTVEDLRSIWSELKSVRGTDVVAVDTPEAKVRVSITGREVLVRADEDSKAKVDVRIPVEVVDALLSGEGSQLNVSAAIRALLETRKADLVSVEDDDALVRVWIDERPES